MYTDTARLRAYLEEQIATLEKQRRSAEQRIAELQALINGLNYARQAYTDAINQLELEPQPTMKALFQEINRRQAELERPPIDPAAGAGILSSEEEARAAADRMLGQEPPARLHRPITGIGGIDTAEPGSFFGRPPAGWVDLIHNRQEDPQ